MLQLLTFRWMLKATVDDSAEQFGFKQEVSEARAVDGDVRTFYLLLAWGNCTLRGSLGLFILLIVQQLIVNIVLGHIFF